MGQTKHKIGIEVGYSLDRAGLQDVLNSLQTVISLTKKELNSDDLTKKARAAKEETKKVAQEMQSILNSSWNPRLNQLDLSKVSREIKATYGSVEQLKQKFSAMGDVGAMGYNAIAKEILNTNIQIKQSSKLLDDMAVSMGNTIKWGLTSSVFNNLTGALQKAWDFSKGLDASLNDIRIVTGKSADEMARFAKTANSAATKLGASTRDFTDAALIYYQQGDTDAVANAKAEITLKTANVTGQSASEVSEQLTAVWNGYKVSAEEAELYIDKLAAVAATTAADLEELSTGMSKVASAANIMGVDIDQLNATLATVVSVTRQAPESVGTAFKTIYARLGDIEAGLDADTTLGAYTEQMKEIAGIDVLTASGELRDMGEVIEEIGGKWHLYSREQQIALSQTMAGTRQYNNLLSLFDNWDMYTDALKESQEAVGTLDKQNEIFLDRIDAKMQQLSTSAERIYDTLFDEKAMSSFLDVAIGGMTQLGHLVDSLGGGLTSIRGVLGMITMLFKKQLGGALEKQLENLERRRNNLAGEEIKRDIINANAAEGRTHMSENAVSLQATYTGKILNVKDALTTEEASSLIAQQKELGILQDKIDKLNEYQVVFQEVKDLEQGYFENIEEAENVTQAQFEEAIKKSEESVEKLKEANNELDGILRGLRSPSDKAQETIFGGVETKGEEISNKRGKVKKGKEKEAKKIYKEQRNSLKGLTDLQSKFNKESEEYLVIGAKIQKIQNKQFITSQDIAEINVIQNRALQNQQKLQQKLTDGAQSLAEAESGSREALELELKARQDIIDQQIIQKERQIAITNVIGAMGQITTLTSSIQGLGTAVGEAMAKTRSWGSVLNTAIIPLTTMFSFIIKTNKALVAYNTMKSATVLKDTLEVVQKEKLNGATAKALILKTKELLLTKTKKKFSDEEIAAMLIAEKIITKRQAKNLDLIISEKLLNKVQKEGTVTTLANAAAWMTHPIMIIAVAAATLIGAFSFINKATKANTEAQLENNEAAIEKIRSDQEQIKTNIDLYNSYINLYDQYKAGKVTKEEMAAQAEKLIDVLGREDVIVKTLMGDYEKLNEKAWEKRKEENEKLLKSAQEEKKLSESNLKLAAGKDKDADSGFIADWAGLGNVKLSDDKSQYIIQWDFGFATGDEKKLQDALYQNGMSRYSEDGSSYYVNQGAFNATPEGILEYYNKMKNIKANMEDYGITPEEWADSEIGQHIETLLKDWEPYVTSYTTAEGTEQEALVRTKGDELDFNNATVSNASDFDKQYDKFYSQLKDLGIEDPEKAIEKYFTELSPEALEAYDARGVRKALAEQLGMDLSSLTKETEGLSNADIKLLAGETENIDDKSDLKNYVEKIKAQSRNTQIQTELGYTDEAIKSLMEGKELTEEQIKDLQKLEEKYVELGQIQDRNSREYLQKLHEIKQALEDEAIAGKEAVAKAYIEDAQQMIDVGVNTENLDEFKDTLQEICEANYEVLVEVKSDIQSDFDAVVGVMENIDTMANKIGDDFIIAAEDLEELNDTFPGILENATILADGTMQLDREIVASKMGAAQAEVQADSEKTVEKLENQRDELLAKRDAAQQIADIAGKMVEGEAMTTEQEGLMNEALNTLKTNNAETTANYEKDTQKDVADTSKINSEAMAQNFSGAYKKMAEDSEKWAKAAKQNMLVATTGRGSTTSGDINTAYSAQGSSGTVATATKGELQTSDDINKVTNWEDVQAYYQNLASSYNSAAINTQGKIAEILARNAKFNSRLTGIGTGKGSDGKSGKEAKAIEAEKDIYHDINVELENIANNLDLVQAETEKLTGQDLINNLAQQYELLNKQIDATAEKLAIAHGEQASLQAQLGALGVTFNSDGTIANYSSTFDRLLSEAQKNPGDEEAEGRFKLFETLVGKYDDLITDTIPGLVKNMQEDLDKQTELKLQAFHHEIELKIDIADATKDWNEFKKDVLDNIDEDDVLGGALANLKDYTDFLDNDVIQTNTKHIEDIIAQLQQIEESGEGSLYDNNEAQALEDLQTYYEQMMEDLTYLHEKEEEIHEAYLDMLDEAQEKFDDQIEALGIISDIIEHDKNIINMIYGEEAYGAMAKFFDKQEEVNLQRLDLLSKEVDFWQAERDAAEQGSDAWEKANENMVAAIEDLNSALEESVQNIQDKYLNTINLIFQNLNNKVTGGMGLDYTNEEWDLINRNADQYLDTVNAIYQTQELQNKYLDAIEQTDNPAHQKKLNDLMQQETDYLREQDKLSKYDLERANLKYELAVKQIALEEAQQNKTKMRLRRDSQGNYTYQYTNDEDQVSSVQQEIANLYNQLYNLDSQEYKDNLQNIYSVWEEFQGKMAEAAQINDPEERAAKELLIKEQYSELINNLVADNEELQANLYQSTMSQLFDLYDQNIVNYDSMSAEQREILDQFIGAETELNNAAFDNMFGLYNQNIEQFKTMTTEQKDTLMNELVPQWGTGIQAMADTIAGEGGLQAVCQEAFTQLDLAVEQLAEDLKQIETNAGQTFKEIAEGSNEAYNKVKELVLENATLIESCTTEVEAIKGVISELDLLVDKYEEVIQAAKDAATKGYDYWIEENKKNAEVDPNIQDQGGNEPDPASEGDGGEPKNNQPTNNEPQKPSLGLGSYVTVKPGTKWYSDSYGSGPWGYAKAGTISYTSNGPYGYNIGGLGWIRKTDIVGYDTGGYTGDWQSTNGKLAMLHQKELVLNAQDTKNILNAVEILRGITSSLGQALMNQMAGISANNISAIAGGVNSDLLEQNVHIDAQFPNVRESHEIETAINNLVNMASQHIQKK